MYSNSDVQLSVVMPCLNEFLTLGSCIDDAFCFLHTSGLRGEVIVVDNGSVDGSVEVAKSKGVRLICESKKGYGNAYLKGIAVAQGEIIVMMDSDGTYKMSDAHYLLNLIRCGCDFVIGSRIKGSIKPNAMPWLHQFIGVPFLTWTLNTLYRCNISDAHSGLRAVRRELFNQLHLKAEGMEFASEMILEAVNHNLKIAEAPITYYPRKHGKSKLRTFHDGWKHLWLIISSKLG